jgi:hypothetical protein
VADSTSKRVERDARLRWVPIANMKTNPLAQREINQARVDRLAATFDIEQIGVPTVSERAGSFYIIDGQHRIEALREIGWGDQQIQCWTYTGLSEQDEAEMFLKLNDTLAVDAYWKFKVGVEAGRETETDIDRIVRSCRLVVTRDQLPGSIRAVGTLVRVYRRAGAAVLARTLCIIRDAFGDAGFEAIVIDGIAYLCQRYNGDLDVAEAVKALSDVNGGVNGLINQAEKLRLKTGETKGHCVAAAAVEIINSRKSRKKVPSYWKDAA